MTKTLHLQTYLDAPPDKVWAALNTPRLLRHVARPILTFQPINPKALPETWGEGAYSVRLWFFGVLPVGRQVIDVSYPPPKGDTRFIRDNGHSALIRRWDHVISVAPEGEGTRYTDEVAIDAGLLTLPAYWFAKWFYGHRQRRWRALVRRGLDVA